MPDLDFFAILHELNKHQVDYILVGGLAALVNGAPVNTFDVDIVYARDAENITRLIGALDELEAVFRIQPSRKLKPNTSHLSSPGHQNLITRIGPLDVIGTIGQNLGYQDLLPPSTEMDVGEGLRVRVLDLETLIKVKEELRGEKDIAALPTLRRTLKDQRQILTG